MQITPGRLFENTFAIEADGRLINSDELPVVSLIHNTQLISVEEVSVTVNGSIVKGVYGYSFPAPETWDDGDTVSLTFNYALGGNEFQQYVSLGVVGQPVPGGDSGGDSGGDPVIIPGYEPFAYATTVDYRTAGESGGLDALDLSDLDNLNNGQINLVQIWDALVQGVSEMEPILAARYSIPELRAIKPVPRALAHINIQLARYFLDLRYGAREDVRKRYDDTLARLKRIAKGEEILLDEGGVPITPGDPETLRVGGSVGRGTRVFTRKGLSGLMGY